MMGSNNITKPINNLKSNTWANSWDVYKASLLTSPMNIKKIMKLGNHILSEGSLEQKMLFLEIGAMPTLAEALTSIEEKNDFFQFEMQLIRSANYTPGVLFHSRKSKYLKKALFQFKEGNTYTKITWDKLSKNVEQFAHSLLQLSHNKPGPIAILSENRIEVVIEDVACLSYGFRNIPLQTNAPVAQLEYILNHSDVEYLFVGTRFFLKRLEPILMNLKKLKHIIVLDEYPYSADGNVIGWQQFMSKPKTNVDLNQRINDVKLDDIATVMYTSGTTGYPKGIVFTYENIISKRFARTLALPIGDQDSFLSFLPMYHTFGRFLELWGTIFWGATYTFVSGSGFHNLIDDFKAIQPTVMISIPKRWQEIYERVNQTIDLKNSDLDAQKAVLQNITGPNLKWGLSAAGYLAPEVFQFFQLHGVKLMSGYGMTEATGGILMTPIHNYVEDSVGKALPGIEIKLADDGELLLRGPYVSTSYWKPDFEDIREDNWFPTEDIFKYLPRGHLQIIDRKKEIYKNSRGQTIAPQRIENLFKDFESIQNAFIVGDHLPYNTALIVLNKDAESIKEKISDPVQLQQYVASIVHSVNAFLAAFERVINFTVIDEDFTKEKDELTEKGTFKRQKILENYAGIIKPLYESLYVKFTINNLEIRFPNWFYMQRGWTRDIIFVEGHELVNRQTKNRLSFELDKNILQLGDLEYSFSKSYLDFEHIIKHPAYALGNEALVNFLEYEKFQVKASRDLPELGPVGIPLKKLPLEEKLDIKLHIEHALKSRDLSINALHPVFKLLFSDAISLDHPAYRMVSMAGRLSLEPQRTALRYAFLRLSKSPNIDIAHFAFQHALGISQSEEVVNTLELVLKTPSFFTSKTTVKTTWLRLNNTKIELILERFDEAYLKAITNKSEFTIFKNILSSFLSIIKQYPKFYHAYRVRLVRCLVNLDKTDPRYDVLETLLRLNIQVFRNAIGVPENQAVLSEVDWPYDWYDAIKFSEEISIDRQKEIFHALTETPFLRESIFLLYNGILLDLQDIPPEGIWISFLGTSTQKTVYRVSITTKTAKTYNFALNYNEGLTETEILEEIRWLIVSSKYDRALSIVEEIGSYYPELNLWSEEYIFGDTVHNFLEKEARNNVSEAVPTRHHLWQHFLWTGTSAYFAFWKQTGYQTFNAKPSPKNIIIPEHDYKMGGRIISISHRISQASPLTLLKLVKKHFIFDGSLASSEAEIESDYIIIIKAIYQALGTGALDFFKVVLETSGANALETILVKKFLEDVEEFGFEPKAIFFAKRRYARWLKLNEVASVAARGRYIQSLYQDYAISRIESAYPDVRLRLFLTTAFMNEDDQFKIMIHQLMRNIRQNGFNESSFQLELSTLVQENDLSEDIQFFLKRLPFPHLKENDNIDLLATRSTDGNSVEMMVTRTDSSGENYRIRGPINPKELVALHHLFDTANLEVQFTAQHKFLIALNEHNRVIAGLFYEKNQKGHIYMDKIVVSRHYRGRGLSRGLMEDWLARLKQEGHRTIITGFLHPGFFYKLGFHLDQDHEGLVKHL